MDPTRKTWAAFFACALLSACGEPRDDAVKSGQPVFTLEQENGLAFYKRTLD